MAMVDYKQLRKDLAEKIQAAGISISGKCTDRGDDRTPSKWFLTIEGPRGGTFSTEYTQGAAYRTKGTFGRYSEPTRPDIVDVLHCLHLDGEAGREIFVDFCASYGYDEDSRKAFETWQACQNTYSELRQIGVLSALDWSSLFADF